MKDQTNRESQELSSEKSQREIIEQRQKAMAEDQQMLSAFMKAIQPGGEMTDELMRWWMSRY